MIKKHIRCLPNHISILRRSTLILWCFNFIMCSVPNFKLFLHGLFLTGNWQEVLRTHIDPEQLPVVYGGTLTDPDGDPSCRTMVRGRNIREGRYPTAGPSFLIANFSVLRCCCRSNMAAQFPGHTMFRTRWRCSMRAVWPSAAAPFSSWNMMLKHLAACWGTRQQQQQNLERE